MSRSPQHDQIIQQRQRRADGGEPINDEVMSVHYSGNSLVVGITDFASKIHDITDENSVVVECYDDGIWIDLDDPDPKE
jgi:hypothetical protein